MLKVTIEDLTCNERVVIEGEKDEEIIKVLDFYNDEKPDFSQEEKNEKTCLEFRELIKRKQEFEVEDVVFMPSGRVGVVTSVSPSGQMKIRVSDYEVYTYDSLVAEKLKHFDFDKYCEK